MYALVTRAHHFISPGLIPKLVEEAMKIDPPYTPIRIEAIEEAGVPSPPEMDAYLKARLDKFYAQVAVGGLFVGNVISERHPPCSDVNVASPHTGLSRRHAVCGFGD